MKTSFTNKTAPYVLLAPLLFTLLIFFGYAFIRSFYFSFTDYNMFNVPKFTGLANYIGIFKEPKFFCALRNTLYFSIIVTACQTAGALLLATIMNRKISGIKFFRAAYYMPSVTSSVVITLIFMWFFQKRGIVNYLATVIERNICIIAVFIVSFILLTIIFKRIGSRGVNLGMNHIFLSLTASIIITVILYNAGIVPTLNVPLQDKVWLNTRKTFPGFLGSWGIPYPLLSIMILNIWTTIPTMSLIYLAGLQSVSPSLYEAASIDGAGKIQQFFYVTVPQLSGITFLVVTLSLIGTLQMFDQVAIIGGSAPLESTITLAYYVYNASFPASGISDIGKAAAAANILAIITLVIIIIQKKFKKA